MKKIYSVSFIWSTTSVIKKSKPFFDNWESKIIVESEIKTEVCGDGINLKHPEIFLDFF